MCIGAAERALPYFVQFGVLIVISILTYGTSFLINKNKNKKYVKIASLTFFICSLAFLLLGWLQKTALISCD